MKGLINSLRQMATGFLAPENRLHQAFDFNKGGWHINHPMQVASPASNIEPYKVRVFFNDADLHKLDDCPYAVKMNLATDPTKPYKYCAFIYPMRENVEIVRAWASAKDFPLINVLSQVRFGLGHAHVADQKAEAM